MKKKTDTTARGRARKRAKPSSPALEQASGRVRAAKDEYKRLRVLAKAAKRDLKEARKALKKARKLAEPTADSKPKPKPKSAGRKTAEGAKITAKPRAKPTKAVAASPRAAAASNGGPRAKLRRRPQPTAVDEGVAAGNSEAPQTTETEPSAV